jgi:hypothetical protein
VVDEPEEKPVPDAFDEPRASDLPAQTPRREARRDAPPRQPTKSRDRDREKERTLIRRTALKFQELSEQPSGDLGLLASILGTSTSVVDLTIAVMTSSAKDTEITSDTVAIMDADLVEAAVEAAALGRPRVKGVWAFLTQLGVLHQEMPASDAKAAVALVRAMREGLDPSELRSRIDAALLLLKK